jgi:hypothetical protein
MKRLPLKLLKSERFFSFFFVPFTRLAIGTFLGKPTIYARIPFVLAFLAR